MTTNEIIKKTHLAIAQRVAVECAIDGSKRKAVEIGNAFIEYGKAWTESIANDGRLDEAEVAKIQDSFEQIINKYAPDVTGPLVDLVWTGPGGIFGWLAKKFGGFEFNGLKCCLNKWFNLDL